MIRVHRISAQSNQSVRLAQKVSRPSGITNTHDSHAQPQSHWFISAAAVLTCGRHTRARAYVEYSCVAAGGSVCACVCLFIQQTRFHLFAVPAKPINMRIYIHNHIQTCALAKHTHARTRMTASSSSASLALAAGGSVCVVRLCM